MKKLSIMIVLAMILALSGLTAWSADKGMAMGKGMMMDKDMGEAMMGLCPAHSMMAMKMMTSRDMVASGDGGVIIFIGNKLLKYDKDLNLVKMAPVDYDYQGMMDVMKDMKKNCSMCQMCDMKMKEKMEKK